MSDGDPKQCRLHAMRCAELARTARGKELKAVLVDLAKNWTRLAESLESNRSLLEQDAAELENLA